MKNYLNDDARRNWQNLIELWKTVSMPFNGVHYKEGYTYSCLSHGEWPNRIWLNQPTTELLLDAVNQKANELNESLTFPLVTDNAADLTYLEQELGGVKKFQQEAMMLELNEVLEPVERIQLQAVRDLKEAAQWSAIFYDSFGYSIDAKVIAASMSKVQCYIAVNNGKPVGTAIIFVAHGVAGVHAVGVLPQERRKGYAEAIMMAVLYQIQLQQEKKVVLQASDMGKPLYLKLGFRSQFVIHNFTMKGAYN
jgi:GNAT superfamily N-acetyltransferase